MTTTPDFLRCATYANRFTPFRDPSITHGYFLSRQNSRDPSFYAPEHESDATYDVSANFVLRCRFQTKDDTRTHPARHRARATSIAFVHKRHKPIDVELSE
jgi:hypothetical protein